MNMKSTELLKYYLKNPGNFAVLVLGERGSGKTKWITEFLDDNLVMANCASFADDIMAESELFGYTKGAFTGADKDTTGLFHQAKDKTLFLDEIHNLSTKVQAKLMTALQTNNKGQFSIRKLGGSKTENIIFRPVFASNKPIHELRKILLPDFYDRISQLVVEIPAIRKGKSSEIYKAFKEVWERMKFQTHNTIPNIPLFKKWLDRINLEGNYRTLQQIAINWHQARMIYDKEEEQVFEHVKRTFSEFHSSNLPLSNKQKFNFRKGVSKKELVKEYEQALYNWAVSEDGYGSVKQAERGLSISRLKNPYKQIS